MPPKNGIEMKVGKLCGEVTGLQSEQARVDSRLNDHSRRLKSLESKVIFYAGVTAGIGGIIGTAGWSLLMKLLANGGGVVHTVTAVLP